MEEEKKKEEEERSCKVASLSRDLSAEGAPDSSPPWQQHSRQPPQQ